MKCGPAFEGAAVISRGLPCGKICPVEDNTRLKRQHTIQNSRSRSEPSSLKTPMTSKQNPQMQAQKEGWAIRFAKQPVTGLPWEPNVWSA